MKKSSFAASAGGAAFVCGLAFASGAASAQGIGAGLQGKADPAQIQQKIQEQTQQRLQAQAEAQARVRAEAQAQQAAARMQQRVEAQAQNQAARAQAQGERALGAVQQRIDAAAQSGVNARVGAEASASTGLRVGQQTVRTKTQAEIDAEAGPESGSPFGIWNPFRATTGIGASAKARNKGNDGNAPMEQTPPSEEETGADEEKRPSRGLRVGQFTDLRGTARAELARSMALRLTAISAMRDRAIEADDVQLLEKADRLEDAVRRVLEARGQGQVDAEAEAIVEAELPAPPAPKTQTEAGVEVGPSATFAPATQP